MSAYPGFGIVLLRLLEHRGTSAAELAAASGIGAAGLDSVLAGAVPSQTQLHALAPVLGYHVEDLFVIADVPVPEELTPLDPQAGEILPTLTRVLKTLPHEQRLRIRQLVEELPQEPRPRGDPSPRRYFSPAEGGWGAVLLTMLRGNRNFCGDTAYAMLELTSGRMYLSESTYFYFGLGRIPLRPDWVLCISAALGMPADELAAMTGIGLPGEPLENAALISEVADLLRACRGLTAAQVTQVIAEARALPRDA